ncbi:MAG: bacteriohemerythrin, partial [Candidatus Falkowbacteria bacterium]
MHFIWKTEYKFGLNEIDKQHEYFVGILDELYDAILNNSDRVKLRGLLGSLINYASLHFATEEKYFDEFSYDGAAEHKLKHKELTEKVLDFQKKFEENKVDISTDLIDFLEDWLVDHLLNLDRKYVE